MSAYTVTNFGDIDTEGSLLYAINQVNLGNYDAIAINDSLSGTYDFATLNNLLSNSNVALQVSKGTLNNLLTCIKVESDGDCYGIHSESASSLAVTNSTGSFEIVAEGDAYGIRQSQFQDENQPSYNKEIRLTFDNYDMNFDVTSTNSSAYGISVSTQSYGNTLNSYLEYGAFRVYYYTQPTLTWHNRHLTYIHVKRNLHTVLL